MFSYTVKRSLGKLIISRFSQKISCSVLKKQESLSRKDLSTLSSILHQATTPNKIPFSDQAAEISLDKDLIPTPSTDQKFEEILPNIPVSEASTEHPKSNNSLKDRLRTDFVQNSENTGKYQQELKRGFSIIEKREKVLVCLDLEYFERDNQLLTEIGLAIFNPIVNDPNGVVPNIKTMHIIVKDNQSKKNYLTVPNNKEKYSFGTSLKLPLTECQKGVEEILNYYSKRNQLVIVGHSVGGDIRMLKDRGFYVPPHEVLDTYHIWRAEQPLGPGSLGELLKFFDIPHGFLHNAGNDAFYNIQLLLKMLNPTIRKELGIDSGKRVITWDQPKKKLNWRKKKEVISKSLYSDMLKDSILRLTETASSKNVG